MIDSMFDQPQREERAKKARETVREQADPVRITALDIPFDQFVGFLIKLSLAAIPAAIIIWMIVIVRGAVTVTLFRALMSGNI